MSELPKALDKTARQHVIAGSIWYTVPGTLLVLGAAYAVVPPLPGLDEPAARVALALRWLPVAMLPYAAVCLVIAAARFFEGAHDPLLGGEGRTLQIHCRVMQNTLEQLVWFALALLAVAVSVEPAQVRIVPIACTLFAAARCLYWWGYLRRGTLGRAPGVQVTFTLNVGVLAHALGLLVLRGVA